MIPFETMGPCKRCGDFLNPCKCELMAKAELLEKMVEALEELDDMFDPTSRVGEIINRALQEYRKISEILSPKE